MTFRDRVAAFFIAHPGEWLDGDLFRTIGGKYAARTRISDCRRELGMTIENRLRKVGAITISEYRFVPQERAVMPLEPDSGLHANGGVTHPPTNTSDIHDVNEWSLR